MAGKPDFSLEAAAQDEHGADAYIIGVDEAGRGPWAGPVVAGAAWVGAAALPLLPDGIDDSKKLAPKTRAAIWEELQRLMAAGEALRVATAAVDARVIDEQGILQATFIAMRQAVAGLGFDAGARCHLLVDGTLSPLRKTETNITATPIKRGDCRSLSIAIAAIAAKETRDGVMRRLDAEYPAYGWKTNMGYGTAEHRVALLQHRATPHHRFSFKPVAEAAAAGVEDWDDEDEEDY